MDSHAIAARNGTSTPSRNRTNPECQHPTTASSADEEFLLNLISLSDRITTIETLLSLIASQSRILNPSHLAVLQTIQTILNWDPAEDISSLIPAFKIETWPLPELTRTYYNHIKLKEAHQQLRDIDEVIRGKRVTEEENEEPSGFMRWIEQSSHELTETKEKTGQMEMLLERLVDCDLRIYGFFLGEYCVESWILEIVLDGVARVRQVTWRREDDREGEIEDDVREGGRRMVLTAGGPRVSLWDGSVNARIGGGEDEDEGESDGPDENNGRKRKNSDGTSAGDRERKYKALAQDMRRRIDLGENHVPPTGRKELFPGRLTGRNPGHLPEREWRPWDLPQNADGHRRGMDEFSPDQQKPFWARSEGDGHAGVVREERRPGVVMQKDDEVVVVGALLPRQELSLRQRQLLELEQHGQLPLDLLPSPHHEDFLGDIQIKGVGNPSPVLHQRDRVPFLGQPSQNQHLEQPVQIHQLSYQQNTSPTNSWDFEWTPTPKLDTMSPAVGMALRNARERTSGSGPSSGTASRANGARRSNGFADEDDEVPLVDAPAPDKSKIVVASQYLFQHQIEAAGMTEERDVAGRLIGIQLIEGVRKALRMPIKTYGTACVFYCRYRYHLTENEDRDTKYDPRDAALACLWLASKAEETPKKSKEILCAARNLQLPFEDHLTSDDEMFEHQSKVMITLERYLLEIVAFDFRARNSADVLTGLCHAVGAERATGTAALAICLDVYRTLAVLKQSRQTLACACLELASRFLGKGLDAVTNEEMYARVETTRAQVIETQKDLLDLYMNHQGATEAGPKYNLNDFMRVSIALKAEMDERGLSRYTYVQETPSLVRESPSTSPTTDVKSTPTVVVTPRTPGPSNSAPTNGASSSVKGSDSARPVTPPPDFLLVAPDRDVPMASASPTSPTSPSEAVNPDDPSQITSIVRFVLDASRARDEKLSIAPYYDIIEQEVAEERDLWVPKISPSARREMEKAPTPPRDRDRERDRDEREDRDRERGIRNREGNNSTRDRRRTYTPPPSTSRAPFLKHTAASDRDRRADSPPSRRASPPPRTRERRASPVRESRNSGGRWEHERRGSPPIARNSNRDRSPANSGRGGNGTYRRANNDRDRSRDRSPPTRGNREDRDRDSGRFRRDDRDSGRGSGRYYRD
ncbi:hypothetical protein FKW77_007401 [Venturia effusa]|uniref:Cyclin-like domain-containing protein n=1 Tax=Venturia effusa TaxID=50376 RepID=A0A517L9K3_9PEZI|nr:hypothetical protein FKW77_007401 [Venturia effusa]